MSSDTAKENVSVVESSMTDSKNHKGNLDFLAHRANEAPHHTQGEEEAHSSGHMGMSSAIKTTKLYDTRYFIMKSLNHQNIQLSIKKGIWATQVMNEPILEEAFQNSRKVILIFSVNMSGFFHGYAQMMSSVGWRQDNVWSHGGRGRSQWGHSFTVKWLQLHDLPFHKTLHLKNPLNDYKPVKISRDCQELSPDVGEALCNLLDGNNDLDVTLQRDKMMIGGLHQMHMEPVLSPSLFYTDHGDSHTYPLAQQRTTGLFHPEVLAVSHGASEIKQSKYSRINLNPTNIHVNPDIYPQFDICGLLADRSSLTTAFTEDDILEMTYEEYLEAYSRRGKRLLHLASTPSQNTVSSTGEEDSDDLQLENSSKKMTRRQPRG